MSNKRAHYILAIAVVTLTVMACGLSVDLGSTPTSPAPPSPFPTWTPLPVSAPSDPPQPIVQETAAPPATPAPAITATDANSQVMADVQDYYQKGYLPFASGQLQMLDDFSRTGSTLKIFDFAPTGQEVQDFALWADIVLHTTGSTTYPNYTGCGFAYRVQNNSEGYAAVLTNDMMRMGACVGGLQQCVLFGAIRGTGTGGTVNAPNGSTAHFSLAVNRDHAWVLVDGALIGQYSLYTTRLTGTGGLDYGAVSNINAGYLTSCQITNVRLWQSRP